MNFDNNSKCCVFDEWCKVVFHLFFKHYHDDRFISKRKKPVFIGLAHMFRETKKKHTHKRFRDEKQMLAAI